MGIFGGPTIQSFTIEFDNGDHVLSAQQLKGRVKVNLSKGKLKARNVKLIITGQCDIKYTQQRVGKRYFHVTINFCQRTLLLNF